MCVMVTQQANVDIWQEKDREKDAPTQIRAL